MNNIANAYRNMDQCDKAEPVFARAVKLHKQTLPPGFFGTGITMMGHGSCLRELQRYSEAETVLLEANQILESSFGAEHEETQKTVSALIDLYETWDKSDLAADWRTRLSSTAN